MDFDFEQASLQEILEYAPLLRREAYVDAALRMQADDNIVGIFGSAYSQALSPIIDEALIYAYALVPVPIVGVDAFIFKYGDYLACDAIKSTMIYLTTQKCPLLYSAKMYVLDGSCPAMEAAFRQCTHKRIHVYKDGETLKTILKEVYAKAYSPIRYQKAQKLFARLNRLLQLIEQSSLSGNDFGSLVFYSRFIFELEQRKAFLERVCELLFPKMPHERSAVSRVQPSAALSRRIPLAVHCPDGIIGKIVAKEGAYFKLVPVQHGTADIACKDCIYPAAQYIAY